MKNKLRQEYEFPHGYLVRSRTRLARHSLGGFVPILELDDALEAERTVAEEALHHGLSCSVNAGFGVETLYDILEWNDGFTNPGSSATRHGTPTTPSARTVSKQIGAWVEPLLEQWKQDEIEWRKGATVDFNARYYALVRAREEAARERDAKDAYLIRQAEIDSEEQQAKLRKLRENWNAENSRLLVEAHVRVIERQKGSKKLLAEDAKSLLKAHEKALAEVRELQHAQKKREEKASAMPTAAEIREAFYSGDPKLKARIAKWRALGE